MFTERIRWSSIFLPVLKVLTEEWSKDGTSFDEEDDTQGKRERGKEKRKREKREKREKKEREGCLMDKGFWDLKLPTFQERRWWYKRHEEETIVLNWCFLWLWASKASMKEGERTSRGGRQKRHLRDSCEFYLRFPLRRSLLAKNQRRENEVDSLASIFFLSSVSSSTPPLHGFYFIHEFDEIVLIWSHFHVFYA